VRTNRRHGLLCDARSGRRREIAGRRRVVTDKGKLAEELRDFGVMTLRLASRVSTIINAPSSRCRRLFAQLHVLYHPFRSAHFAQPAAGGDRRGGCGTGRQRLSRNRADGVHLGHYGIDQSKGKRKRNGAAFGTCSICSTACRVISPFAQQPRSSEARADLVEAMARSPRVVPHLHLCLQSGSDRILRLMKRRYTSGGYLERCDRLKQALDQPAFTTDVIVGFPGETKTTSKRRAGWWREVGFAKIHVFTYSPEPELRRHCCKMLCLMQ